ncbi:mechanosensitive ion channel family protein [Nocardioides sp. CER19]|uniref:mechanosensitive ion channel family protein n=1 Tax=Nocardioides sp. CER19 TaxID=3038538 RepID=UPI0024480E1E|nr:mechanosensitive ion channel family protein [Nocardioides sp. CER19]MDH2415056.1 mechanosensitive ion channel family protein [Nocardioides sp. CER19]
MLTTATTAMTATAPPLTSPGAHTGWLQQLATCQEGEDICQQVFDWTHNQTAADAADIAIGKPLAIIALVALALLIRWVLFKLVNRVVKRAEAGVLPDRLSDRFASANATRRVQRAKTMGDLLKSVLTGILIAVFGTMILDQVGVNIAPIIASAGIVGIALGFGAQSLVKDFLSGVFMIFEDQYGVGDVINLGEASGTVEAVSLRVTRLRDVNGTVWYVPNGEILRVGNMSQNWSRAVVDVTVGYREDLGKVITTLRDAAHDLWEDEDFKGIIIEEPEVTGVETLGPESVSVRVMVKTEPMEQWKVARELRSRIKARFDHEGISIPVTQRVQWQDEAHAGT